MEDSQTRRSRRGFRRRSLSRRALTLFGLLLVVLIWLWFATPPKVPEDPVRLIRDGSGEFVPVREGEEAEGFRLEFEVGKLTAQNNFSSSSTETRSPQARFPCQRMTVFNLSDHLLMKRVGKELLDRLNSLSFIEQLDYYPVGHRPAPGEVAPDIIVKLDLDGIEEQGGVPRHRLDASILVSAGNRLVKSRSGYHDDLSPPVVEFEFDGRLQHLSTTTGIRSSAARYKQAAADIAEQVAKALLQPLEKFHQNDRPLPEVPEAFYPAYREPTDLQPGAGYTVDLLASYHGLLTHGDSYWRLATERELPQAVALIEKSLQALGWQTSSPSVQDGQRPRLRLFRDEDILTVFPPRESRSPRQAVRAAPTTVLYVHHLDRMSREDLRNAIDESFDAAVEMETLLLFEGMWTEEHRQRMLGLLESRKPVTARGWLAVARLYRRSQQDDLARGALRWARWLTHTLATPGSLTQQISKLAEELGVEETGDVHAETTLLREMGFLELGLDEEIAAVDLPPGDPAHFFLVEDGSRIKIISLRAQPTAPPESTNGSTPCELAYVESRPGSRSWGSGGMTHTTYSEGHCSVQFTAVPIGGDGTVRLSVEIVPVDVGDTVTRQKG